MSTSGKYREDGNTLYKSINQNLSPAVKTLRLEKTIKAYQTAINEAENDDDLSSAYKNIANPLFDMVK